MNLSQILINAGVTPEDLHPECRFIAQDGDDGMFAEYEKYPDRSVCEKYWHASYMCEYQAVPNKTKISSDWRTPLSREQFTADYAAHQAAKQ